MTTIALPAIVKAMQLFIRALVLIVAAVSMTACKSLPGGDGEYATFDRGQNNRGSP
jgi:hypothetical protein